MAKRRVLLFVFSISSILVLAGFAANEKAYAGGPDADPQDGLGDFYCFDNVNPVFSDQSFDILDQFGPVTNDDWEQDEYCTAANKFFDGVNFVSPFDSGFPSFFSEGPLNQHYQGWLYPAEFEGPAIEQTVILDIPQLGQNFQTTIDFYDLMLVPANKTLDITNNGLVEIDSVNIQHHWNCYGITGPSLDQSVDIFTQHGDSEELLTTPFLLCAPMIKDNEFFPDEGLDGPHMVCYDLVEEDRTFIDQFVPLPIKLADQVAGKVTFEINDVDKFCVPAFKSFPVIGGFNVPIDTSSLLLAGVQSISMWMIPVVIAGVGISIFVIKRRK